MKITVVLEKTSDNQNFANIPGKNKIRQNKPPHSEHRAHKYSSFPLRAGNKVFFVFFSYRFFCFA